MKPAYLLVPCRNEAGNIPMIVDEFLKFWNENLNLVLIEGNSNDNTEEVCRKLAKVNKHKNVSFQKQEGKGKFAAIRTALRYLYQELDGVIVVIWDSDHSIKLESFIEIMKKAQQNDCFVYTERIGNNIEDGAMRQLNYFGNVVIAKIASHVFGFKIKDALSGTKIFPGSIFNSNEYRIREFVENDSYGDLSYFLLAKIANLRAIPHDVNYFNRQYGESSLKRLENGVELLRSLINARWIIKRAKNET